MKTRSALFVIAALFAAAIVAGDLTAHTTVVKKNTPDGYHAIAEPDGAKSVVNQFSIPHGCDGETIIASAMLFPNGGESVIEDQDGNPVSMNELYDELEPRNNVVMGPKPALNANWKFQEVRTGPVPEHNNHGLKGADVRAFVYKGGKLRPEFLGLLPWRATFAAIKDDSCLREIVLRIPIVNYCQRRPSSDARMDAWIGRLTAKFNDPALVSTGWWPQMSIVNTNFDEAKCGDGKVFKVSPSDDDIDRFLPITSFKP